MHREHIAKLNRGFTLIQVSVMLTIASLIMVATLPGYQTALNANKVSIAKMNVIMNALRQYQSTNGVLPCPADATYGMGNSNYGVAAANAGASNNCTGSTPAANAVDSTTHIALGMVPVRTLGLPLDYAIDGYGRDITYAVDTNATACWPSNWLKGTITVTDNGINVYSIAVLVSHGSNGHGAWLPMQGTGGSGSAQRLNTGSTDAGQVANAQVTSGTVTTATPFTSFVNSTASVSSTFDDLVVYKSRNQQWNLNSMPLTYYTTKYATTCTCTPYYRAITIDHTKVPNSDQSNFPFLFAGTYSYLAAGSSGVSSSSGYDIAFTSDSAGTNVLPFEQESYNSSTGDVNYWVLLKSSAPYNITLSHTADTVIYLQYCTAIKTDQSNKTAVWTGSNTYRGVWHFGTGVNGATAKATDSTGVFSSTFQNGTPGTVTTPFGPGAGNGKGVSFNGGPFLSIGWDPTYDMFEGVTNFTFETWTYKLNQSWHYNNDWSFTSCNPDGGDPSTSVDTGAYGCTSGIATTSTFANNVPPADNCPSFFANSSSNTSFRMVSTSCPALNTWYHVAVVKSGTSYKIYVNGVDTTSGSPVTGPAALSGNGNGMRAGNSPNGDLSNIYMDEFRISTSAYGADWIKTEYNNQNSPSTFYSVESTAHPAR